MGTNLLTRLFMAALIIFGSSLTGCDADDLGDTGLAETWSEPKGHQGPRGDGGGCDDGCGGGDPDPTPTCSDVPFDVECDGDEAWSWFTCEASSYFVEDGKGNLVWNNVDDLEPDGNSNEGWGALPMGTHSREHVAERYPPLGRVDVDCACALQLGDDGRGTCDLGRALDGCFASGKWMVVYDDEGSDCLVFDGQSNH